MAGCCGEEFDPKKPKVKETDVTENGEALSKTNYTPYIIGLTVVGIIAAIVLNII